jgi:hypothetical protein
MEYDHRKVTTCQVKFDEGHAMSDPAWPESYGFGLWKLLGRAKPSMTAGFGLSRGLNTQNEEYCMAQVTPVPRDRTCEER